MQIARMVLNQREKRKLNQVELARSADLSAPTIAALENGSGRLQTFRQVFRVLEGGLATTGAQLKRARLTKKLSLREVARLANLAANTVSAIERDDLSVRAANFEALARVVEVPIRFKFDKEVTWTTPPDFAAQACELVGGKFDFDVASPGPALSPIKADRHFTIDDDGLSQEWSGTVWMNPPYERGQIARWLKKAASELQSGRVDKLIALLPASTDTEWWADYVTDRADVFFLKGRLTFGGQADAAPFGCVLLVYYRDEPDPLIRQGIRERFSITLSSLL